MIWTVVIVSVLGVCLLAFSLCAAAQRADLAIEALMRELEK